MAFFGNDKKSGSTTKPKQTTSVAPTSKKINSATIITACMEITGNLQGSDTLHVDGKIIGDITVSNTLVIGKSGLVVGEVKAKNAIINGELQGSIQCDELEVMQTGKLSKEIHAKHLVLDGQIEGIIMGESSIEVLENAKIKADKIQAPTITVHGAIEGKIIATELLDIGSKGSVEGEITVKKIKTAEGGRMVGSMSTYEAPKPKPQPTKEPKEPASTKES